MLIAISRRCLLLSAVLLAHGFICFAQTESGQLQPTPRFALPSDELTIRQAAIPNHPFTVTGSSGAILGMQDGDIELWQLPVKFFSDMHLTAEVDGYPLPIDLNSHAAEIAVSPDHTTITYSHAAITVRQHMFVPAGADNNGLGGMVVFEIEAIHPATLTISLTPAMVREWPAPQYGQPSWSWQPMGSGGAYVVSTDNPELFGMIGMANATPGIVSPYQERPSRLTMQFRLHFDPARDAGHFFPLLCEAARPGETNSSATIEVMKQRMIATAAELPEIFAHTHTYYAHFFDNRLVTHTPKVAFDKALRWAELSIEKAKVTSPAGETGLVAGWYPSFDSARPGFGWFFGRDTLWSIYAIDSYGDAALARQAMDFLVKRQRADGKMMHEFPQTADMLTGNMAWSNFPYEYAAADSTPLYLLAMRDYIRTTADRDYLKSHWESLQRAYHFERTHDSDGDGVYDNSQGTGWVEDWPKPPHQELYLAALDRDATATMSQLASWMDDASLAKEAQSTATLLSTRIEEYRRPNNTYAFSKNADGSYDSTLTVYPSVALWNSGTGLANASTMLTDWAAHSFATDWGTRAMSDTDPAYDPISYHRGTVWPLFTGWTSMAEYRAGRPLAGYAALQCNVGLTWAQDPGTVTELLSGRFYQPLGRSSTHQLWSSAMTLAPAVRGLFGLEPDAPNHTLLVHPHLPASWDRAELQHVQIGGTAFTVTIKRSEGKLLVAAISDAPSVLCLHAGQDFSAVTPCSDPAQREHHLDLPLPVVELELQSSGLPAPGSDTSQPRVIDEAYSTHGLTIVIEAQAGSTVKLVLRRNHPDSISAHGAEVQGDHVVAHMPPGSGFVSQRIELSW
jgi:glycogen debranching enzyme